MSAPVSAAPSFAAGFTPKQIAAAIDSALQAAAQRTFLALRSLTDGRVIFVKKEYCVRSSNSDQIQISLESISADERFTDTGYSDQHEVRFRLANGKPVSLPLNDCRFSEVKPGGIVAVLPDRLGHIVERRFHCAPAAFRGQFIVDSIELAPAPDPTIPCAAVGSV